tara:strand:- start:652 stop:768 length:117 start_codon:yes stop_codon:yes gene_type:complete
MKRYINIYLSSIQKELENHKRKKEKNDYTEIESLYGGR